MKSEKSTRRRMIIIFAVLITCIGLGTASFFGIQNYLRSKMPVLVTVKKDITLRINIPEAASESISVICLNPDYAKQRAETGNADWTAYQSEVREIRQLTLDDCGLITTTLKLSSMDAGTYTVFVGTHSQTYETTFRIKK